VGVEPTNGGFADLSLSHLGTAPEFRSIAKRAANCQCRQKSINGCPPKVRVACTKPDIESGLCRPLRSVFFFRTERAASSAKKDFTGERGLTTHRRMRVRGCNSAQIYRDATGRTCASRMNLADSSGGVGQI
jgi:hypothetical protein